MSAPRPCRLLLVLLLLAGSPLVQAATPAPTTAATGAAPPVLTPPTNEEWARLGFWHRFARIRPHSRDRVAVQELLAPILADDPDDLMANFLWARTLAATRGKAPEDSVAIAGIEERARSPQASPGQLIAAASAFLEASDVVLWRRAVERARLVYLRADREEDAFRALLLRVNFRGGDRDVERMDADLEELRLVAEASGDPVRLADYHLLLAKALYSRDLAKSVEPRQEAIRLLEPFAPHYQLAYAHWALGNSLRRLGRPDEALAAYDGAVAAARAVGAPGLEADAELGLGQTLRRKGELQQALVHFEAAAAGQQALGDLARLVPVYLNFRTLHHDLGDHAAARRTAERTLELAREYGSERAVVAALDGFASEEAILGRLDNARRLYEEAIGRAPGSRGRRELIYLHYHLSGLEADVGDLESAREAALAGLGIAEKLGDRRGQELLELQLALISLHSGDFEDALAAAVPLTESDEPRIRHDARRVQATAMAGQGRPEEALAIYDQIIADAETGEGNPSRTARVFQHRGNLLLELGRVEEAIASFRAAVRHAAGDPNYDYVAGLGLANALAAAGRWEEATPLLERGLALVEEVNSGLTVGEERSDYLDPWYDDYVALARAYVETDRPADAFAVFERARARELRRALRSGAPGLEVKVRPDLAAGLAEVEGELSLVQQTLVERQALEEEPGGEGAMQALEARADSLKRHRDDLVARIERESPQFAREIGLQQVTLAEFQVQLQPDELVLGTMSGRRAALALVVGARTFEARVLPWVEDGTRARVAAAVADVRANREASPAADELAAALLPEVVERAPRALFVLPDGALHRLPFEVLPLPDGRRLVEAVEVAYASSATLLADSAPGTSAVPAECSLLAFGDPLVAVTPGEAEASPAGTRGGLPVLRALPHARREVTRIGELLEDACIHVGADATENEFFRQAGNAAVVHLAAHAYVDDARPGYSGIVLASDSGANGRPADGIVQAFEVVRADIPAGLVTLSACDTGGGEWQRGEGLIGLARAFRIAGAQSLVVSLWEVDDAATADFMVRFYENLIDGARPAAALREAKLSFLGRAALAAPSSTRGVARRTEKVRPQPTTWAAFVLLGPGPNPFPGREPGRVDDARPD